MAQDDSTSKAEVKHPGMMGDGTEEQNLGQEGDPKARITREEVEEAFGDQGGQSSGGQSSGGQGSGSKPPA